MNCRKSYWRKQKKAQEKNVKGTVLKLNVASSGGEREEADASIYLFLFITFIRSLPDTQ